MNGFFHIYEKLLPYVLKGHRKQKDVMQKVPEHQNAGGKEHSKSAHNRSIMSLTIFVGSVAFVSLIFMFNQPGLFLIALLVGLMAFCIDFLIEYGGIHKKRWGYPKSSLLVKGVPAEVPTLFFFCGILVTFTFYLFSGMFFGEIATYQLVNGVGLIQIILFIIAVFFLIQYLTNKIKTLTFWALPLALALFTSFSNPWFLLISTVPVYIDYYLEKRLVISSEIAYGAYDEQLAINVAISYFPTTLLILGLVAVLVSFLNF